jgi:hypothetical protein
MPRVRRAGRHKNRATIAISILGLALLLASLLHSVPGKASETSTESPAPSPANDSYVFKVYALNHTSTRAVSNGTALFFDMAQLQVNFSRVRFGDCRMDSEYSATYYAGSGILLNSSGTNAWITLREGDGKLVSNVFYHGQPLVVFNGQTMTYVNCDRPAVFDGTDMIVQDWRKGNWTPNDGIVIEHPKNVTISGARFYLAVYQPGVNAQMPEFDLLPAVVSVFVVVVLARRFKK